MTYLCDYEDQNFCIIYIDYLINFVLFGNNKEIMILVHWLVNKEFCQLFNFSCL